jgi:hypothetical protein
VKKSLFLIMLALLVSLLTSCQNPVEQPDVYYLSTETEIITHDVGNVFIEFIFSEDIPNHITVRNSNGLAIGVKITNSANESMVLFSDGWIGRNVFETQSSIFEKGDELFAQVIVYNGFGATLQAIIDGFGGEFLSDLSDSYVSARYEQIIILQ